jgi:hypothetical protein
LLVELSHPSTEAEMLNHAELYINNCLPSYSMPLKYRVCYKTVTFYEDLQHL